jgi:cytochrome c oxidase cbb3-type subunit I/II
MWTSGITQGVMLNATAEGGTVLAYPNFLDTLNVIRPMMLMRVVGGGLYLVGWLLMAYNLWQTIRRAQAVNGTIEVFEEEAPPETKGLTLAGTFANPPVVFSVLGTAFACAWMFGGDFLSIAGLVGLISCVILAWAHFESRGKSWAAWYDRLLVACVPFTILTFVAVVAGGLIQIIPTVLASNAANVEDRRQIPYTPLERAGRDIYVREGCYNCHSQMIRTLVPDVLRYGDYSRLGESIYDHPFQWGSKRTGPDLAREGDKYNNIWHLRHLEDPRGTSPGSNMPKYPWLFTQATDVAALTAKIAVQRTLGVPYPNWTSEQIGQRVDEQAKSIAQDLRASVAPDKEVVAMIAYLQKLGKHEGMAPATAAAR